MHCFSLSGRAYSMRLIALVVLDFCCTSLASWWRAGCVSVHAYSCVRVRFLLSDSLTLSLSVDSLACLCYCITRLCVTLRARSRFVMERIRKDNARTGRFKDFLVSINDVSVASEDELTNSPLLMATRRCGFSRSRFSIFEVQRDANHSMRLFRDQCG
jgi:hypothetical protein